MIDEDRAILDHEAPGAIHVARKLISDTRAELGHDLGGHSVLDLLADNFTGQLDDLRKIAARAEEL